MVKEILAWIQDHNWTNIVIGGDFNTVPYSSAIRRMNRRYTESTSSFTQMSSVPLAHK